MSISQLSLTDFRNLQSTTVDFHPSINLISGDNGSGKTSLLEAIYVLCQACSFRTHHLKKSIQHGENSFLLFGRFDDYKAGLSKSDKKLEIRVNGETIKRRSSLVNKTPINIVNADSLNLITGSPQQRRQYLDWCMFHVEHSYSEHWQKFQHALKQRNKILKTKKDLNLLDYWDDYLIRPSLVLMQYRQSYCDEISKQIGLEMVDLLNDMDVEIEYQQGWDRSMSLQESLRINRGKDIKAGFTRTGIHRDNLVIKVNGYAAVDVLSRGQLKRLSLALIIAALKILKKKCDRPLILLVDDLRAEMDELAQKKVYQILLNLGLQLFITNIESRVPDAVKGKDFKMFHVEHGIIKPRNSSQII